MKRVRRRGDDRRPDKLLIRGGATEGTMRLEGEERRPADPVRIDPDPGELRVAMCRIFAM